jgi:hypothetical protein
VWNAAEVIARGEVLGVALGSSVGLGLAAVVGLVCAVGLVCGNAEDGGAHAAATRMTPTESAAQPLLTSVCIGEFRTYAEPRAN